MKPNRYQNPMIYQLKVLITSLFESTAVNWGSCHLAHITLGPLRYVTSATNYSSRTYIAAPYTKVILFTCNAYIGVQVYVLPGCRNRSDKGTKYSFFSGFPIHRRGQRYPKNDWLPSKWKNMRSLLTNSQEMTCYAATTSHKIARASSSSLEYCGSKSYALILDPPFIGISRSI